MCMSIAKTNIYREDILDYVDKMKQLIDWTSQSFTTKYPSLFGCAIYDSDNRLISIAHDTVIKNSSPIEHAEVNAINNACKSLKKLSLKGCTLYSTCEPCPMCMSALIWAEIETLVYSVDTIKDANKYWHNAQIFHQHNYATI